MPNDEYSLDLLDAMTPYVYEEASTEVAAKGAAQEMPDMLREAIRSLDRSIRLGENTHLGQAQVEATLAIAQQMARIASVSEALLCIAFDWQTRPALREDENRGKP